MKNNKSVIVTSLFVLFLASQTASLETIQEIWVQTADCSDCGMTSLGHISAKICGNNTCCFSGKLYGRFNVGAFDVFAGSEIGECDHYQIESFGDEGQYMGTALYHTGTDGGQFDFVEVLTLEGHRFECQMENRPIDDNQFIQSNRCNKLM
eukprot:maker-scaffold858_size87625-snap-gene-0.14 protein:Tk04692 transcript:maker-scaffold858_size87625-snap-gene-0.14-mRNA-1 annotation:"p pilus assembly cpx signaling periplasmic inhibitor zinc-resistance associated protein"